MKSINETIADQLRGRGIVLSRLEASQRKKILKMLDKLLGSLALYMSDIGIGGEDGTDYQKYRMKELWKTAQNAIEAVYDDISGEMTRTLSGLMKTETAWLINALNKGIGIELITLGLTQEQIMSAASDALILNAPSSEWWSRQSAKLLNNFKDTIRQGWLRGETNAQLLRRLTKSTDEKGNPIFDLRMGTRRGAEAVIRTSVQQIANDAHMLVYKENSDVVKGVMWVATLDQRTTPLCASLDGLTWDLDGNPIGHDKTFEPPPRHWGCRSVTTCVLKSFRELGIDLDEIPESTRASMDGQVPAGMTFDDWLRKKEDEQPGFVAEMFGKGKARLWEEGKISIRDMTDQTGRELTLKELIEMFG